MDFHSMKRKELQALSKKHSIPANLTNLEMANKLSALLKEKEKRITRGRSCLKNSSEIASENDSDVVNRQSKKVRFSPENEMIELEDLEADPRERRRAARRRSMVRPVGKKRWGLVVENVDRIEPSKEIVDDPVRITRSRAQKSVEGCVITIFLPPLEKKRTRRGVSFDSMEVKDVNRSDKLPPVTDLSDNLATDGAAVEETKLPVRRLLRNREVVGENKKDGEDADVAVSRKNMTHRSSKKRNAKSSDEISENEGLAADGGITQPERALRRSKRNGTQVEERKNPTQRSSKKRNAKSSDEISENEGLAADGGITQPEEALRRSKRHGTQVEDSELLNGDLGKNEMVGRGRTTRSRTQLVVGVSAVDGETKTETKAEVQGESEVVLQLEEPSRHPGRHGNRRKSVMPQIEKPGTDEPIAENDNRKLSRTSVLEGGSSYEIPKEIEKVALPNVPLRRSRRNTSMFNSTAPTNAELGTHETVRGNESLKQSSEQFVEKRGSSTEEHVRRSRRNSRHESVAVSDAMEGITNAIGKNKQRKRRRDPVLEEETAMTECAPLIDDPPRRSTRSAAKSESVAPAVATGKVVGKKKQQSKFKSPNLEVEAPLVESISTLEEPPMVNAQLPMPEVAGSATNPVLSSSKEVPEDTTTKKRKESGRKSLAKGVYSGNSDLEEARDLMTVNSVESPVAKPVELQSNHTEISVSESVVVKEKVNISIGVNKEKSNKDDIRRVNEDDSASQSWERSEFDCNNFVEPEPEVLNMANDVGFAETTPAADGCSPVYQSDYMAKPAQISDMEMESETDENEKPSTGKAVHPSCVMADHKDQNLLELEEGDGFGEPIVHELVVDGHLAEFNKSGGLEKNSENTSEEAGEVIVIDPSDGKRITPILLKSRKADEAEKSAEAALLQESACCKSGIQNIEVESSLTKNVLAFEEQPTLYAGLSEPEDAEHSSKEVHKDTNKKRKGSTRKSIVMKRRISMEVCTKSPDLEGARDPVVVKLEGTPASNSVKLQSDSAGRETDISVSEFLVFAEKKNIIVVGNENLLQDETHKGNEYDLAAQSQKRSGDFDFNTSIDPELVEDLNNGNEYGLGAQSQKGSGDFNFNTSIDQELVEDLNRVSDAISSETFSGADGFFPVHQSDFVANYAAGDDRSSVHKEQNLVEFGEVHRFVEPSTHERDFEVHFTGSDESVGAPENCEYASEKATEFGVLDPSDGGRITPITIEGDNDEADYSVEAAKLQETISVSHVVTSKSVAEKDIEVHFTTSDCALGTLPVKPSPECQASCIGDEVTHFTGHAISIDNDAQQCDENQPKVQLNVQSIMAAGNTNCVETEKNLSYETEIHDGTMRRADTFVGNAMVETCNQEGVEEALTETENKPEGQLYMERALQGVDGETSSGGLEGNSCVDGSVLSILNELDGQIAKEKENAGSNRNCVHASEEIGLGSLSEFSDGERISQIISEKRDTDRIEDTLTPTITPESSGIVNNESMSSFECTPLKDDDESSEQDELKILFATPANNRNPNEEEETSSHETEMDDLMMAKGFPQEVVGTKESEHEEVAYKGIALLTAAEEITDEGSNRNVDAEFTASGSTYTALDGCISKDGYVAEDKESEGSKPNCENASGEHKCVNVLEVPVGTGIPSITSEERDTDKNENFEDAAERNAYIAESHVVGAGTDSKCSKGIAPCTPSYAPEYQASGTINKEMLYSKRRLSTDNDLQDQEMNSSADDLLDVPFNKSAIVAEAKHDGKVMEGGFDVECNNLATEEENAKVLPEVEFCDPGDGKEGVAQVNGSTGASLPEIMCKESEVSEEKLTAELIKSTSKCIKGINLGKGKDNDGALSRLCPLGLHEVALDHGVEFVKRNTYASGVSNEISDKVAEEKLILADAETNLDYNDSDDVLIVKNGIMPEHGKVDCGGSDVYRDEIVPEQDKDASTASDKLTGGIGGEDLAEIPNEYETMPQVDGVKFGDFSGHKMESMVQELHKSPSLISHELTSSDTEDGEDSQEISVDVARTMLQVDAVKLGDLDSQNNAGITEGNLNIMDKNSDAEKEDFSLDDFFDHHLEHEKVLTRASFSPLDVSNCDVEDYESHVYEGDLSIAVSPLASVEFDEDRVNAPTVMDKPFKEDNEVTEEKDLEDIRGINVSNDAKDGSNVEDNVRTSQEVSKGKRINNEDALEEDALVGGIGCLASNNPLCGNVIEAIAEETAEASGSLHNIGEIVLCASDSNESAELQNFLEASISRPAVNVDCSAVSSFSLSANHGTIEHKALELNVESHIFSSWEIDLFFRDDIGDGVEKLYAEASETNFVCEDSEDAREMKENVTVMLAEEQLGKHEEKVTELNDSHLIVSDEPISEDEVLEEKYTEKESVEVEKSSFSIHDVILTEVANINGCEPAVSVEPRAEGSKYSEVENIANAGMEDIKALVEGEKCGERGEEIELSEAVLKPSSRLADQLPPFIDSPVDGGSAAEDAQKWEPKSELVRRKNPTTKAEEGNSLAAKRLNYMTMKRKSARTSLIQGTPKKLITTLDMKENALSIKREHMGNATAVKSVTKRHALEDLQKK